MDAPKLVVPIEVEVTLDEIVELLKRRKLGKYADEIEQVTEKAPPAAPQPAPTPQVQVPTPTERISVDDANEFQEAVMYLWGMKFSKTIQFLKKVLDDLARNPKATDQIQEPNTIAQDENELAQIHYKGNKVSLLVGKETKFSCATYSDFIVHLKATCQSKPNKFLPLDLAIWNKVKNYGKRDARVNAKILVETFQPEQFKPDLHAALVKVGRGQ